uniref:Uncharacterized protein n=2 Tax=Triticum urartu TaxID=4572 RepID=A0A8R7PSF1_TRIUA
MASSSSRRVDTPFSSHGAAGLSHDVVPVLHPANPPATSTFRPPRRAPASSTSIAPGFGTPPPHHPTGPPLLVLLGSQPRPSSRSFAYGRATAFIEQQQLASLPADERPPEPTLSLTASPRHVVPLLRFAHPRLGMQRPPMISVVRTTKYRTECQAPGRQVPRPSRFVSSPS